MQPIYNPFKTAEIKSLETKIDYQNVIVNNLIRQVNELEKYATNGTQFKQKVEASLKSLQKQIDELDNQDTERYDAITELEEHIDDMEESHEKLTNHVENILKWCQDDNYDDRDLEARRKVIEGESPATCCQEPEETKAIWQNVRFRAPEEGQYVLCYCSHAFPYPSVQYCKYTKGNFIYGCVVYNPDYWAPLPKVR